MSGMRRRKLWLALVVGASTIAAVQAAALGGLTAPSLLGLEDAASAPTATVNGCDNFSGTTGATMASRAAQSPAPCSSRVWTAHVGTWTIQTNQAASSATSNAVATENITTADTTVQVVLFNLNTGGRFGGVVNSHNGTSTYLAAVMTDAAPDRAELRLVVSGSATVLTTVNPTFATTNTLAVARSGATITVKLNSATIITYNLSAAQVTSLGSGVRDGLYGGNASVRYDDFLVTSP